LRTGGFSRQTADFAQVTSGWYIRPICRTCLGIGVLTLPFSPHGGFAVSAVPFCGHATNLCRPRGIVLPHGHYYRLAPSCHVHHLAAVDVLPNMDSRVCHYYIHIPGGYGDIVPSLLRCCCGSARGRAAAWTKTRTTPAAPLFPDSSYVLPTTICLPLSLDGFRRWRLLHANAFCVRWARWDASWFVNNAGCRCAARLLLVWCLFASKPTLDPASIDVLRNVDVRVACAATWTDLVGAGSSGSDGPWDHCTIN